jgi:hypothetical protein
MDYRALFIHIIEDYLAGRRDRQATARAAADNVGIGDIPGDRRDLLPNCEWALRHMSEPDYYTEDAELRYYLECLKGVRVFSEAERDAAIGT